MKGWLLSVALTGLVCNAAANNKSSEAIARRLQEQNAVQGTFHQVREVEGIPGGLRSQGSYLFWRGHGIYWATERPIQRAITYRQDMTLLWSSGNESAQALDSRKDRHFRKILLNIFSFDLALLEQEFELQWRIDGTDETDSWQLELSPRKSSTRRFLSRATLWGEQAIEGLTLEQANGERLQIKFSEPIPLQTVDLSVCRQRFAYSPSQCQQLLNEPAT